MPMSVNDYEHVCDLGVEGGNTCVTIESVNDTTKAIADLTTHLIEESVGKCCCRSKHVMASPICYS
jgi:hypothetical protein